MKLIGKVYSFNGKYGTIVIQNNDFVDFDSKDISFNKTVNIGDIVMFRLETKPHNIKIARNIARISNEQQNINNFHHL